MTAQIRGHGGARPGAGRKRKKDVESHNAKGPSLQSANKDQIVHSTINTSPSLKKSCIREEDNVFDHHGGELDEFGFDDEIALDMDDIISATQAAEES